MKGRGIYLRLSLSISLSYLACLLLLAFLLLFSFCFSALLLRFFFLPAYIRFVDMIGVAKTGSGKTCGFLLPGFMKILGLITTKATRRG
jgi:hypothetical protein